MFILDNSGSMALVSMPFDVQDPEYFGTGTGASSTGLEDKPYHRSYLNNTIYYNPAITYRPWMTADGVNRLTGGTNVSAVYTNWNLANGSNMSNGGTSVNGTRDLRGNDESIFYVPHAGVVASTSASVFDYDRYRVNASGQVVKGIVNPVIPSGFPITGLSTSNNNTNDYSFTVPVGATTIEVTTSGGTGNLKLSLRDGSSRGSCSSSNGNDETCSYSVSLASSKVFYARLQRNSNSNSTNYSGVTLDVTYTATSEVVAVPSTRSEADELTNIATWYSYYRTRIKTAKGGASEAFATLGRLNRVGYTPINVRPAGLSATGTTTVIPVDTNGGLFEAGNKTTWFNSLQNEVVKNGSTPLRTALDAVGKYYTRQDAKGPWGPGATADQISCRQNFSILTTDGYWNDSFANALIGDSDGDGKSHTLADVASYYYLTDMRPGVATGLKDNVPVSPSDAASWQHMVTFSISIGLSGTLPITTPPPASNSSVWPDVINSGGAVRIDDLWHAAVNGHGQFFTANDPNAFALGLKKALSEIAKRTSSYSNVATNSVSLDTGAQVFNASYVSGTWEGSVTARSISEAGVSSTISWTSSLPTDWTTRKIITYNGTSGAAFPTSAQQTALERTGGPVDYAVTGPKNVDYIRGDQSLEGPGEGELRVRDVLIGDIVGSSPAYVKDTKTLYVGANDGMLHAFDADTGVELFGYIPNSINWADLKSLSSGDYTHKFFVDGPIVVSKRSLTPNKNILVGSLGKGGKGLYALDVTSPTTFGAGDVKWERSSTSSIPANDNMGLVIGKPFLGHVPGGQKAVILGNGMNSKREKAVLIVLDIETGAVIQQIDTGVGSTATPNGLSSPVGVYGQDGKTIAYVYAGDMLGNVWKFDMTAGTATKLFTAVGPDGAQPISAGVTVAINPLTRKRWVFFGTGRYLTLSDADSRNTDVQSMYGFVDEETAYTRADLTERTIMVTNAVSSGYPVRGFEAKASLPATSKGWYVDLPGSGERIVQDAQIVSTFLITSSMVTLGDACQVDGTGYINAVDAFTGTSAAGSYFDLNKDGLTDDGALTGGLPVGSVSVGAGMPTLASLLRGMLVTGLSSGVPPPSVSTSAPRWDRVSWREIRKD